MSIVTGVDGCMSVYGELVLLRNVTVEAVRIRWINLLLIYCGFWGGLRYC